jgi:pimeloyl-ACP methyl ester carboxylesterase
MKKFYFSVIIIAILVIINNGLYSQQTGQFTLTYNDRGVTSSVYFWVPGDYDSTKTYPFLLGWHGAGDTGGNMRTFLAYLLAQRVGAILVCPDANNVNGKDVSYFSNLTSAAYSMARDNYSIDTNKIVIMGFSWGGAYSYQIGLLNPQLFKGIIGLAPAIGSFDQTMWNNINKIRMATILGDKDFNYTAVNALMLSIKNSGANLLYIVKPGVQHVDNAYFNSQAIIDDFRACYEYVVGDASDIENNKITDNLAVNIYPNPVQDFLSVKYFINSNNPIKLSIINSFGIELINETINENQGTVKINTNGLPSGIYYCILKSGNYIETKRFVILK